jgi:hypothetical protein
MVFGPKYSPPETPTEILTEPLKKKKHRSCDESASTVHPDREWIRPWYKM